MTLYLITKIKTGSVYPSDNIILLRYDNLLLCYSFFHFIMTDIQYDIKNRQ
ncbi:hypothetical protein CKO_00801 [Citrobacter koseri ATCC BAA-895]|uniref:Uncharacterized protein n=1 Tax=Citrobacter koseri (strain ATCC BAA-895 / CDC 4225-83 / SGSC4696) TaxID=290338 RepID=A8AEP0_CITK8|nr:hypothetical protein CKO_00801 [Citrobacter koseri ATCC BAA-895]KWZ99142.1 hypothetical protein HMPREF3220_02553 [Citrobacter koseri]KWZ99439.1 hypothetical protein HMPREF3207_03775 [Citrobacter koseri]